MSKTILWQDDMLRLEKLARTPQTQNLFERFLNEHIGKDVEIRLSSGYTLNCILVYNDKGKKLVVVSKWNLLLGAPKWFLINKAEIYSIATNRDFENGLWNFGKNNRKYRCKKHAN